MGMKEEERMGGKVVGERGRCILKPTVVSP